TSRAKPGPPPIRNCQHWGTRFGVMAAERLWLRLGEGGKPLLDGSSDAGVQCSAMILQKRVIGSIANQRVFKAVSGIHAGAVAKDEFGLNEFPQRTLKLL